MTQRNYHRSAFAGGRRTWSPYSQVWCVACWTTWRSKGAYVDRLPDGDLRNFDPPGSSAEQRTEGDG